MKDLLLCVNVVVKTLNLEIVIWQTSSKKCTKVPAARAARLFVLIQPIRSLFSGVVGNREFHWLNKGLFTWREGALATRLTELPWAG